ncbi:MAG: diaminopimelate decarboxylase [Nitrososphaerota archaeon]|jgi:diaminopimelate decarboxylase|nr:diaminopimelate decarboxylase [Nitrososphaerota archaeon]MDG6941912.1 diaminopimelate decarboxylase [Nitrososphaerota archaeon]MDG6946915.1 diaminopimelate decarboxylase [Nitrososphaerota archaeon]
MDKRRPHLNISRASLRIGGVEARSLAEKYGTPLYVTDVGRLAERFNEAKAALSSRYGNVLVAFAYKSNSTPPVVERLAREGAGATVVSVAGIELAIRHGVFPGDIVLDGPSKSKEELSAAIKAGVGMINAESTQEARDVEALSRALGSKGVRLGFRVNFGIEAETHAGLATGGREHKFGVARDEVVKFCRDDRSLTFARVAGLHSHIGSQVSDAGVFRRQTEEMVSLAGELEALGTDVEEFNLGGGLGVPYKKEDGELSIGDYADATAGAFARSRWAGRARLVFELGRWVVADSTILLTRVNYVKAAGRVRWALVDAGMNDFIRPSLYGAYHEIVPAWTSTEGRSGAAYDVAGPVCESTDVFGRGRRLGVSLAQGDLLAILDAGAYGSSMSSTYNMRPLTAVATVEDGRSALASPRRF